MALATDGVASMIGCYRGLMTHLRRNVPALYACDGFKTITGLLILDHLLTKFMSR